MVVQVSLACEIRGGESDPERNAEELVRFEMRQPRGREKYAHHRPRRRYSQQHGDGPHHPLPISRRLSSQKKQPCTTKREQENAVEKQDSRHLSGPANRPRNQRQRSQTNHCSQNKKHPAKPTMRPWILPYPSGEPPRQQHHEEQRRNNMEQSQRGTCCKRSIQIDHLRSRRWSMRKSKHCNASKRRCRPNEAEAIEYNPLEDRGFIRSCPYETHNEPLYKLVLHRVKLNARRP